jgi:hypothetical protein
MIRSSEHRMHENATLFPGSRIVRLIRVLRNRRGLGSSYLKRTLSKSMNRIRLALFRDGAAAASLRDRLIRAGIPAEVHDELQLERLWFVSKAAAGARLEVPFEQWERTTQLLLEWDASVGVLRDAIRCPECRSLRVEFPQVTRKSFLTNLAIGLMAELRLVERQYYCEDCHCMWPRQRTKPGRQRAHLAPNYFVEGVGQDSSIVERRPHSMSESKRKAA